MLHHLAVQANAGLQDDVPAAVVFDQVEVDGGAVFAAGEGTGFVQGARDAQLRRHHVRRAAGQDGQQGAGAHQAAGHVGHGSVAAVGGHHVGAGFGGGPGQGASVAGLLRDRDFPGDADLTADVAEGF